MDPCLAGLLQPRAISPPPCAFSLACGWAAAPRRALEMGRIAWAAPVAGAAVGLIGALVLALTTFLGLPPLLRAGLTTAALVASTGALHEDGLADVADGFGGGATRAAKLEIMRDSRVGAYGAAALGLALILRVGALAASLEGSFWRAALSLILVAAVSRAAALLPLALLARRARTARAPRPDGSRGMRSPPPGARRWSLRLRSASSRSA